MNPFRTVTEELAVNINPHAHRDGSGTRQGLAFTLIELLVVISVIALLASLIVGLSRYAAQSQKRSRIRAELNQVITAIEAYKAHFGHYPPDNVLPSSKIVNPVTNQLFYELTGVLLDESKGTFHARDREQRIPSAKVMQFFHRDGFVNAGANPKEVKPFIDLKASQRRIVSKPPDPDIEVLAVSVDWPLNDPNSPPPFGGYPDPSIRRVNPMRYVSTNPTNNPDSFDLWAEFVEGGKLKIICNWSKDVLDR